MLTFQGSEEICLGHSEVDSCNPGNSGIARVSFVLEGWAEGDGFRSLYFKGQGAGDFLFHVCSFLLLEMLMVFPS